MLFKFYLVYKTPIISADYNPFKTITRVIIYQFILFKLNHLQYLNIRHLINIEKWYIFKPKNNFLSLHYLILVYFRIMIWECFTTAEIILVTLVQGGRCLQQLNNQPFKLSSHVCATQTQYYKAIRHSLLTPWIETDTKGIF